MPPKRSFASLRMTTVSYELLCIHVAGVNVWFNDSVTVVP
jgi:hypothetical protein